MAQADARFGHESLGRHPVGLSFGVGGAGRCLVDHPGRSAAGRRDPRPGRALQSPQLGLQGQYLMVRGRRRGERAQHRGLPGQRCCPCGLQAYFQLAPVPLFTSPPWKGGPQRVPLSGIHFRRNACCPPERYHASRHKPQAAHTCPSEGLSNDQRGRLGHFIAWPCSRALARSIPGTAERQRTASSPSQRLEISFPWTLRRQPSEPRGGASAISGGRLRA